MGDEGTVESMMGEVMYWSRDTGHEKRETGEKVAGRQPIRDRVHYEVMLPKRRRGLSQGARGMYDESLERSGTDTKAGTLSLTAVSLGPEGGGKIRTWDSLQIVASASPRGKRAEIPGRRGDGDKIRRKGTRSRIFRRPN